jgi:fumarylpyruvate hydrolase
MTTRLGNDHRPTRKGENKLFITTLWTVRRNTTPAQATWHTLALISLYGDFCMSDYVFNPPAVVSVPVLGHNSRFPVHRIYCVGRNYEDHAKEMGFTGREPPFFFVKPADTAVVAPAGENTPLPYPGLTQDFQHEVELVVAIGVGGSHIAAADAMKHVFGYAVGLDMTRRDLQTEMKKQGRPWCIGKAFDHASPIGTITPANAVADIGQSRIWLDVNGQRRQSASVSQLIWSIPEIIEHLSKAWALQAGDLIYTGTPAGVAAVRPGDRLEGNIDGLQAIVTTVA